MLRIRILPRNGISVEHAQTTLDTNNAMHTLKKQFEGIVSDTFAEASGVGPVCRTPRPEVLLILYDRAHSIPAHWSKV